MELIFISRLNYQFLKGQYQPNMEYLILKTQSKNSTVKEYYEMNQLAIEVMEIRINQFLFKDFPKISIKLFNL